MKPTVDKETCIGCGLCEGVCPEVFKIDDDGKSVAICDTVPEGCVETAQEARDGCPVEAISLN